MLVLAAMTVVSRRLGEPDQIVGLLGKLCWYFYSPIEGRIGREPHLHYLWSMLYTFGHGPIAGSPYSSSTPQSFREVW